MSTKTAASASPRVSIITPLHNGADYIAETLASVQAQTWPDYEHLVIDDGSTDDGMDIVTAAAKDDPRIVPCRNDSGASGPGPTRNVGLRKAAGRYAAFLDADDTFAPDKLERQVGAMIETGAAFSWTAYLRMDAEGVPLGFQRVAASMSARDWLHKTGVIGCSTTVIDRDALGDLTMSDLPLRQDFCYFYAVLQTCDANGWLALGIDEPLAMYRVHSGGVSADKARAARAQWTALRTGLGLGRVAAARAMTSYTTNAFAQRGREALARKLKH